MATSAYLSDDLREYIEKHKLEFKVSNAVNNTLRLLPEDPNSHISLYFSDVRPPPVTQS